MIDFNGKSNLHAENILTVLLALLLIVFNEAEAEVLGRRGSVLVFNLGVVLVVLKL